MTQSIECSLPPTDQGHQLNQWTDLHRNEHTTTRIDGGVTMTFDIGMADDLEALATAEASCCSFLSIAVTRTSDRVSIEVTSDNPDALPVIEALAGIGET